MIDLERRHRRVAADTNVFIYHLDADPRYGPSVTPLFEAVERRSLDLVTSAITLLEILVKPLRVGSKAIAAEIFAGLSALPGLEFVPVDVTVAARAADLRARYRLGVPDAVQLATAIAAGATAFVCHDQALSAAAAAETDMEVLNADGKPTRR